MRVAILLVPLAWIACGGGGGGGGQAPAEVDLSATGASPASFTIPSGGQINFVNKDTVAHQITSPDCAELNSPQLAAGQTFSTTVSGGPKNCTFTDTRGSSTFNGAITVGAPGTPGNGY